jgi:uncharacterized protein with FMN-binding domain
MNKKIIIFLLVFIFALSGCGTKKNTDNNTNNGSNTGQNVEYKDGVYDVKKTSTKFGYEEAIVTIKDSKIESIDLKRLDANQAEINYEEWNGTTGGRPNLKQARVDLAAEMVKQQSSEVDAISGATQSSNNWKAAVAEALSKAK